MGVARRKIRPCFLGLCALVFLCTVTLTESLPKLSETLRAASGGSRRLFENAHLRQKRTTRVTERTKLFDDIKGYPELDIIFALERSSLIDNPKRNFEIVQKKFVRKMIRDFLLVADSRTHVALMTYAADVTMKFNGISSGRTITKCELIGSDYLWDQLVYIDGTSSDGLNISEVYKTAAEIFNAGRRLRPRSRALLILLTSGFVQPGQMGRMEDRNWFDTYGVGITDYVNHAQLRRITENTQTSVVGTVNEWLETMRLVIETSHVIAEVGPEWVLYNGQGCNCPQTSNCYCDVRTGFTRCTCQGMDHQGHPFAGYYERNMCVHPCASNICTYPEYSCRARDVHYECSCNPFTGCDIRRIPDCPINACQNGGKCYDGKNQYACVCPSGFGGVHCEVNENECRHSNICPSGQACQDGINSFTCYDPNPQNTPTPIPPHHVVTNGLPTAPFLPTQNAQPSAAWTGLPGAWTNPTKRKSTYPSLTIPPKVEEKVADSGKADPGFLDSLSDDQRLLLTVVPPAGLGFIVLVIGLGTLIYVCCKKDERAKNDLSAMTETTSVASHNPSLVTFDSKCYTDEGTPGPPKLSKAAEVEDAKRISYGEFDDMLYGNEALQNGMEEWYSYVLDLYHHQGLNRILIIRLDFEKWVLSPGSKLYKKEIEALYNILSKKVTVGTFEVQGREFGVVSNSDFVIMAHTFRNSKRAQEILCATKTRQFVIIGSADFSTDNGKCKKKVLELRDHIKVQGL